MRELSYSEIEHVSGAGFFSALGASFVGALAGITEFGLKWAMSGGSTGGLIGAGIIAAGVGLIVGAVVGLVDGAVYGLINDWDTTVAWFNKVVEHNLDPSTGVVIA
ncbi:MAG: hypothetical protein ACRC0C_00525 [Gibbsiella quercinecans]|uniref:hypothetical protein n=1 Tax=Gibbsiella quercinecans TaxID=929813 RepID=UPI003F2C04AB